MNNIILVVVVSLFIFGFIELLLIIYISNRRNNYRRIISNEKIREQFSKSRTELFKLVSKGELDSKSYTFMVFYKVQSFILRNPDKYEELANLLADAIVVDSPDDIEANTLKQESKEWSENTKKLAFSIGKGFAIIIDEYAPLIKLLPRLRAKLLVYMVDSEILFPEQKSVRKIYEAESTMFDLAGTSPAPVFIRN